MTAAFSSEGEDARLDELFRLQTAKGPDGGPLDKIVRLTTTLFSAPIAYLSLLDRDTQRIDACMGIAAGETPREGSFCAHTILGDEVLVVSDALCDVRLAASPWVRGGPAIRFYAGAPLVAPSGRRLGALCVADVLPRDAFSPSDRQLLKDLAALAIEQMELRRVELARSSMISFMNATEQSFLSLDTTGKIEFANRAACQLFGYAPEEIAGEEIDVIIPERLRSAHRAGFARVFAGGESKLSGKTIETSAIRRDGAEFPIELSLSVWRSESGVGVGAVIRDVSDRRDRDARLLRLANHDTLTGLCNRRYFGQQLADRFTAAQPSTVMLLDLDGFKDVNDTLGHGVGDTLLQAVAIRLPAVLPASATTARFGGDEFAVLLPSGDPLAAQSNARAVVAAFEEPFEIEGHTLHLAGSVGFSMSPGHGEDSEELIASADFALYRAKKAGGRSACMFETEMRSASAARRALQDELMQGLQKGEFELH